MLEIAKEMKILLEFPGASPRIVVGGHRVQLAFTVDPDRRHLADWGIERAWLTAGRIFRVIDAQLLADDRRWHHQADAERRQKADA
jgi:hypothetical protein